MNILFILMLDQQAQKGKVDQQNPITNQILRQRKGFTWAWRRSKACSTHFGGPTWFRLMTQLNFFSFWISIGQHTSTKDIYICSRVINQSINHHDGGYLLRVCHSHAPPSISSIKHPKDQLKLRLNAKNCFALWMVFQGAFLLFLGVKLANQNDKYQLWP